MSKIDLPLLQHQLQPFRTAGRTALLPALHAVQDIYGYIPEGAAKEIGQALGVPLADIYGVIEFYSMFYPEPVGSTVVHVCTDIACALRGGEQILKNVCRRFDIQEGETSADGFFTIQRSPCLGLCEHAPAALVNQTAAGEIDRYPVEQLLAGEIPRPQGIFRGTLRHLTANCGKGRPTSLAEYLASGGYEGLRRALRLASGAVIAEVKESGLAGRGGAAFPTGLKWEGAVQAPGEPKYVICNADESEPGTFKDRGLMEEDPHRTLEGMIITGYAIGASKGYIYVRGEYPHAFAALSQAAIEAQAAGFLGRNILASGFDFEVEFRRGAGAYICGEETALFESIEGKRGFPRIKPPFPTTHGLFEKPTVIMNVESLCNIPLILANGAAAYRQIGTEKSVGSKLFCLSGDVKIPGIYEAPFGVSLRHLLYDLAGGMRSASPLQAVLFGGAAGAFATPEQLDVEMSFEALKTAGLPLGSGVVLALDQTRDLRRVLLNLAHFFAHESCGKCYPCQIGTQRQLEILERLADAKPLQGDAERLSDIGWTMSDASICGLGQTAASAVLSAMRIWPEIFGASK